MKTAMRKIWAISILSVILAMGLFGRLSAQTGWTSMGLVEGNQASPNGSGMSLAIDTGGSPIIAYGDDLDSNKITVRKFTNGIWTTVGNSDFSTADPAEPMIAINSAGVPYVTYMDVANGYQIAVMTYNGTSWVPVGAASLHTAMAGRPHIAIDNPGNIFLLYQDTTGYIKVLKYDGNVWAAVGVPQGAASGIEFPMIAVDGSGTPYISYVNYNTSAAPVVEKYNGSSWVTVGSMTPVGGSNGGEGLAIDASGKPYIAYSDPSGNGGILVQSFDGTSWSNVGNPGFTTDNLQNGNALGLDASGHPYIVTTATGALSTHVYKYDGSSWSTAYTLSGNVIAQIAMGATGTPYLSLSNLGQVQEYTGGNWITLGNQGVTNGLASNTRMVTDNTGTPYVAYTTGQYFGSLKVMEYSNFVWTSVGGNISGGTAYSPNISMDRLGVPYVSYLDSTTALFVKKYNGSSWTNVGSPFPTSIEYLQTLKVSYSGTPYVSYLDGNRTARIKTYNGSAWVQVDTGGFSPQNTLALSFDVDRHDMLYVAYFDSITDTLQVLKYDGAAWSYLSPPAIVVHSIELSVDSQGTVYLMYTDPTSTARMLSYDGSTWAPVGSTEIASNVSEDHFVLDNSGKPYVVYSDGANNGRESVKTYTGSSWANVGQADFTMQSANSPAIAVSPTGVVYTVFSNNGAWGYLYDAQPDSVVWPGDADANHIVDNTDLLPIGLAYDSAGPARAVQGIVWQGDAAVNWADSFSIYAPLINFKHADCDGNGTINADDTLAIIQNFSLTHAKDNGGPSPWRSATAGLRAQMSADSLYAGDTLTVTFMLGDTTLPVTNIYGLAFTYNFDMAVVDSSFTSMSIGNSWMGTNPDKISIHKVLPAAGQIKAALTRIDHASRSGFGPIATAKFKITTDNISGKDLSYYANIGFISDITAVDQLGNKIALNAGADTSQVGYTPNAIKEIRAEKVYLYPNPAHDRVTVSADDLINDISITNVAGQEVYHSSPSNTKTLNVAVSDLQEGLYFVQIKTNRSSGVAKLSITR